MAGKRKAFVIPLVAVVAVAAVIALVFAIGKPQDHEAVSKEEFLLIYENEVRPRILSLSQDPGGDWYNESYEETTLGAYARELTATAVAQYKARQKLFRESGIWDFTYDDFLNRWKSQEQDGNPYGVQSYSQYDYYVYLHSVYSLQLMQEYTVEDADARRYYEQNTDQFKQADVWELEIWQTGIETADARSVLEQAMLGSQPDGVVYNTVTLDADAAKYYPELLALVQEDLEQLKEPEQILYREKDGTCFLIRSAGFTAGQPVPYAECEDLVRNRCRQQMLDNAVAEALEDITVQQQALPAAGK